MVCLIYWLLFILLSALNTRRMMAIKLHGQCQSSCDSAHGCSLCLSSFRKRQNLEMTNYLFNRPLFPALKLIQSQVSESNGCLLVAKSSLKIELYMFFSLKLYMQIYISTVKTLEITKLLNHEVKEPLNPSPRTTQLEILVWKLGGSDGKASAYNAGDPGSIPGLGRFPGERNGNPLQYPCL